MAKIRDLPEEVVTYILSFLKLRERKNVSRVSRLYNRLVFADTKAISLLAADYLKTKERKILLNSNRRYRHLILEWTEASSVEYLVEVLNKFGKNLISLKLNTYTVTPTILLRFLSKTPNLQELTIEGWFCIDGCDIGDIKSKPFEQLRSLELTQRFLESELVQLIPSLFPRLTSLDLVAYDNSVIGLISFYGKKQLKNLSVLLEHEMLPNFSQLDCLENIIKIDVRWPLSHTMYTNTMNCLQQMSFVRSASFSGTLGEYSYDIIFGELKHLEYLCINVQHMEVEIFKKITNLNKLKKLKLLGSTRDQHLTEDIQLPSVSHLILDGVSLNDGFYCHLHSFVPNVWYLKIYDHRLNNGHLRYITRKMPNVRVLLLDYCYQIKHSGFKFLNKMTNLRELRFWLVPLAENDFSHFPRCPNLRTLSIGGNANLTRNTVLGIPQTFPNLKELQMVDCFNIDDETIYTLQEQMKKCAVVKLKYPDVDREAEPPLIKF